MPRTQAHFVDKAAAEKARAALIAAGVAVSRVHIWNDLEGSAPFAASRDDASESGALLGGVLGGVAGLAAGAAIGSTYEKSGASASSSSVRLIVEGDGENGAIVDILKAAGATQVNQSA